MANITGDSFSNTIDGTVNADTISGLGGNDTLSGLGGNDTIDGGSGNDRLIGGAGKDTILGGFGNDTIVINGQTDIVSGESYSGGAGTDTLSIETGSIVDLSSALINSDIEILSASGDVKLKSAQLGNFLRMSTGTITLTDAGTADLSGAHVFNNTTFNLSALGNTLDLTGVTDNTYTVNGGAAADVITGGDYVFGDTLNGGSGNDTLNGGAGNDFLIGGAGADIINGGTGDDTIFVNLQTDIVAGETYSGGAGQDTLQLTPASAIDLSAATINADVENLSANNAVKLTSAQLGGFQSVSTSGAITLTDAGTADLSGAHVFTSTFNLSASGNTLDLTGVTDSAYTVNGGAAADVITGGDNSSGDILKGAGGDDKLDGGAGNDSLTGGAGADVVNGGTGDDTIFVNAQVEIVTGESYAGGAGTDTLQLNPASVVDLSAATINADVENLSANNAVKLTSAQLGNFLRVATGAITLTDAGTADLSGAHVVNGTTFNLSATGNTLDLTGVADNIYTVIGGAAADVITGGDYSSGGDTLKGGGGNDTLNGGAGSDSLTGGAGADIINGGTGDDTIFVTIQTDIVAGETYSGGAGQDTLQLTPASVIDLSLATISADVENLLSNNAVKLKSAQLGGFQSVNTSGFAITLTNAGTADLSGAHVVNSTTFNLSALGNTLDLTGVADNTYTVNGGAAADVITGGDYIFGDTLNGGGGNDTLNGGAGLDFLTGGAGADTINGGAGDDTIFVNLQTDIVAGETYSGGAGQDTLKLTPASVIDLSLATIGADVENLVSNNAVKMHSAQLGGFHSVNTNGFAVTLTDGGVVDLTGHTINVPTFNLSAAGNTLDLTGLHNAGAAFIVNGGSGQDIVFGGIAGDTLVGGGGNDTLDGAQGNDTITGGAGTDSLSGGFGDDTFVLANQTDAAAGETYAGGAGDDTLLLTSAGLVDISALAINSDIETLQSTAAAKLTSAQLGTFAVIQTGGAVTLTDSGTADLTGHHVVNNTTFNLNAAGSTIDLTGVSDNSYIVVGGAGNDVIRGGDYEFGDDLRGGLGDDTINGGEGSDTLNGGAGLDIFVFNTALNAGNVDTIVSYSAPNDTMELDHTVFTGLAAGALSASAFVIAATAQDASDRIIYDDTTGAIYFDRDGTGAAAAVQFATVATGLAITETEFFVL